MKLKDWMKENRYTQTHFATLMNPPVTISQLNSWIHGRSIPLLPRAIEIQQLTKGRVKPSDWIVKESEAV